MSAPRRTRIKFCGMRRREDIELAVAMGVDAIGLIFAERSPRRVDLDLAQRLREAIPPFVSCVALVMDTPVTEVRAILQRLKPDLLQFHGAETAAECLSFDRPYLRAVPMADPVRGLDEMARHPRALGWVLDSHAAGGAGGSGQPFDWATVPAADRQRVLLAGGLGPDNVAAAVRQVRPWAVDVSSGIESAPGVKDASRMRRFVEAVRAADTESD